MRGRLRALVILRLPDFSEEEIRDAEGVRVFVCEALIVKEFH